MAAKQEEKVVRLVAPSGVKVRVRESKAEKLTKRGYKRPGGRPPKTADTKTADTKTADTKTADTKTAS